MLWEPDIPRARPAQGLVFVLTNLSKYASKRLNSLLRVGLNGEEHMVVLKCPQNFRQRQLEILKQDGNATAVS